MDLGITAPNHLCSAWPLHPLLTMTSSGLSSLLFLPSPVPERSPLATSSWSGRAGSDTAGATHTLPEAAWWPSGAPLVGGWGVWLPGKTRRTGPRTLPRTLPWESWEESWDRWLWPQPMGCPWEGSTGEQKEMSSSSPGLTLLGVWRPGSAHSDPGGGGDLLLDPLGRWATQCSKCGLFASRSFHGLFKGHHLCEALPRGCICACSPNHRTHFSIALVHVHLPLWIVSPSRVARTRYSFLYLQDWAQGSQFVCDLLTLGWALWWAPAAPKTHFQDSRQTPS